MKVIQFRDYQRKKLESELSSIRQPLYSSHLDVPKKDDDDFGLRMQRIRESLWRINERMHELRESAMDYTR